MIFLPKSVTTSSLLSFFSNYQLGPGSYHLLGTVFRQERGREEEVKEVFALIPLLFVHTGVDEEAGTAVLMLMLFVTR